MIDITSEEYIAIVSEDQLSFTQEVFNQVSPGSSYMHNWHIDCIIDHLQAVEAGDLRRLIINVPPGMMKSITVSTAWPAWLLGKNPATNIFVASYAEDVARKLSLDTRLVMESEVYRAAFPETNLSKNQNQTMYFQTDRRGARLATTVGGTITGMHADYLIIDDPIKPDESSSETVRRRTNDWIAQTYLTREKNPFASKVVCIMQRLHENDPSGFLLDTKDYHHLMLPAYFEKKVIIQLGDKKWNIDEGDYLHQERLGPVELEKKLQLMGAYAFAGQYQQRPAPVGGGEFKKEYLQFYDSYSKGFSCVGMNIYILYDPANEKKKTQGNDPDYTAMVVVGLAPDNNYYILDIIRDRLNPTERIKTLINLHKKWNKKAGKAPKVVCEQYGMMTDAFYLKKAQDESNYRFHVIQVGGKLKKEDRIRRLIPLFENARFYLPKIVLYNTLLGEQKELIKEFVDEEMMVFPVGKHDDILDALARILDPEVHATFPEFQVSYLKAGQTEDDVDTFSYNDFMSW